MTLLTMSPFKTQCDPQDMGPPHPGEILREDLLPHYKMAVGDFAQRLGIAPAHAADLIAERIGVDAALAARLGTVFALCPRYWQALQLQYDLWQNRSRSDGADDNAPQTWNEPLGAAAFQH